MGKDKKNDNGKSRVKAAEKRGWVVTSSAPGGEVTEDNARVGRSVERDGTRVAVQPVFTARKLDPSNPAELGFETEDALFDAIEEYERLQDQHVQTTAEKAEAAANEAAAKVHEEG